MSGDGSAAPAWKIYVGTCGVLLGAGIVSLGQRLLSAGLPDLRGALGLGFDEAAWIPTANGMALMFMGPFSVYLGGLLGPRRVLLTCGAIFTVCSIALPFAPNLPSMLALQALGGLASGTFYPLSLSYALRSLPPRFTIYGIGAYSMELLSTLSIGTPLQAWFVDHWSWRWIFWTSAALTPVMMLCVWLAVAPAPKREGPAPAVSWRGFVFASAGFSLLEGALEQGERLDWFGSGTIVAMVSVGVLLVIAMVVQRRLAPNPLVSPAILAKRNILILGAGMFTLRFNLLSILVLIPGYLAAVAGYRPLQTGRVLLWVAGPTLVMGFCAARLSRWINGRLIAAFALTAVAVACLMDARLTSAWAADQFWWPQLLLASGLAFQFVGQTGMVTGQGIETGALLKPVDAMAYAAYFQTLRLFGGQVGSSVMQRLITVRTTFHSNILARSVEAGQFLTDERLRALSAGFASVSGTEESQGRATAVLVAELTQQATTLSYMDGFILVACVCTGMMLLLACMKPIRNYWGSRPVSP